MMLAATLLLIAGTGLLGYALWVTLASHIGTAAAATGLGVGLVVLGGVLAWTTLRLGR